MADEIRIADNAKLRTDRPEAAAMFNAAEISRVWLWDIGPSKPKPPTRPEAPKVAEGTPAGDIAKLEFAEVLEQYQAGLKRYRTLKAEFDDWNAKNTGPYIIPFWSCDAQDAISNDLRAVQEGRQEKRRYYLCSRTRGRGDLPNGGLPEGMKPGKRYESDRKREAAGEDDLVDARRRDPVFGQQELRS